MHSVTLDFNNFCRDEYLKGHAFLRPSIFVVDSAKRVFSKIDDSSISGIISEVIVRIFLSIVITLIALPSALLSPLGILIKSIDMHFIIKKPSVDTHPNLIDSNELKNYLIDKQNAEKLQKEKLQQEKLKKEQVVSTSTKTLEKSSELNLLLNTKTKHSPNLQKIAEMLNNIEETLKVGNLARVEILIYNIIFECFFKKECTDDRKIILLTTKNNLLSTPQLLYKRYLLLEEQFLIAKNLIKIEDSLKNCTSDLTEMLLSNTQFMCFFKNQCLHDSPIILLSTNDNFLTTPQLLYKKYLLLEEQFLISKDKSSEQSGIKITELGEIEIPKTDDGNCLFHSFIAGCQFYNIEIIDFDKSILRNKIVQWITDNYLNNKQLQDYILMSLDSFFDDEIKRLQKDLEGIKTILSFINIDPEEIEKAKNRQEMIPLEIKELSTVYDKIKGNLLNDDEKNELFVKYLKLISAEDTFSSFAEIYALANVYHVQIELYRKVIFQDKDTIIKADEDFIPNELSIGTIKILHVNGNHYVPYAPPIEQDF